MTRQIARPDIKTKLGSSFFQDSAANVAQKLIGRTIVRELPDGKSLVALIREVAAWQGEEKTSAKTLKYHPGIIGISNRYGHNLIDIGTGYMGRPSCVTIAGIYTPDEVLDGPGKVSRYLAVDDQCDSMPIENDVLWIGGEPVDSSQVLQRTKQAPANCKGYFYFNDCMAKPVAG